METYMKNKLISLCGAKGSGKSAFAKHLMREDPNFKVLSFATPIREMLIKANICTARELYEDKDKVIERFGVTGREMLQTLGSWGRALNIDFWVKVMENKLEDTPYDTIIDDCRYENEASMTSDRGGKLIYIKRSCVENGVDLHSSEAHYKDLPHDEVITNDGTEIEFLDKLIEREKR